MSVPPELVDRFRADLEQLWPFVDDAHARLGLAVSGGADSLALLLLAHALLPGRIEAATVDHGLRPEAAAEADLVARRCAELGVPHQTHCVDVARGNLQDRARAARYEALGGWCEERDLEGLATGHQMDDQAETFLMRLNRGSGVTGLAGIRALGRVPTAGVRLVRPLLRWRRAELAALVHGAGWEPVQDPSNEDDGFDRVRIRRALASADWLDPAGIERSARLLGEADAAIDWVIGREWTECVETAGGETIYRALRTGIGGTLIRGGVIRSIYRSLGAAIGPAEAAELVVQLVAGRKSNLAGIQASVRDVDGERIWAFAPENPRRTG
jgi:tRNA(Ile)-lysidine synthase